ncbi:MAG: prephenate/arogenate dehydrogenase [Limnothrix sp. CACIAM 69d]|nr:MAG: prephenate/arogenate dehydrogenase [Limnothrix sp. CACIAM 69d]
MRIGVVGLGLIGGSLGLALRPLGHEILGVVRRPETAARAIELGIADRAGCELSLLADADLVILCTPIGAIEPTVRQLIPHLSPSTVLTDVGSVKQAIVQEIEPLWPNFVGAHPMAGTADSGIEAALPDLFVGRPFAITPTDRTPTEAIARVTAIAQDLRSTLYRCTPEQHDRAVAWISHLPVAISASLIAACGAEPDPETLALAQSLASSGFRDTSRVGGGNPELGVMMAQFNRPELLRSLQRYRDQLDQIIGAIDQQDWAALQTCYEQTQQARSAFVD